MSRFITVAILFSLLTCCACETATKIGGGCADVVRAATSGRPSDIINACRSVRDVATDPGVQRDIQKIEEKCEDQPNGPEQDSSPEGKFFNSLISHGEADAAVSFAANVQERLEQACSDCAAASAICASYGEPLPNQIAELQGACCETVSEN